MLARLVACALMLGGCELLVDFPDPHASDPGAPLDAAGDAVGARFMPPIHVPLATTDPIRSILASRLNADETTDLVITTAHELIVVYGDGMWSAPTSVSYPIPDGVVQTLIAEMTGDDQLDVAVASSDEVRIWSGQSATGFGPPIVIPLDGTIAITSLAAGKLSPDPYPDIVLGSPDGLVFIRGDADGFSSPDHQEAFANVIGIELSDVAPAPGVEEVLLQSHRISIVGNGYFDEYDFDDPVSEMVTIDLDGDAVKDLLAGQSSSLEVVLRGAGRRVQRPLDGARRALATGDLDGDGDVDVVTTSGSDVVLLANAQGELTPDLALHGGLNNVVSIAVGRFNTDDRPDVAVATSDELLIVMAAP